MDGRTPTKSSVFAGSIVNVTLVNDKLKNHLQCVQSSQPYQKLIDHALELEQRGGQINMCNALEELRQEETVNYIKNTDKRKSRESLCH